MIESIFQNIKYQMSLNRKVGPLKELQGLLWKSGYESGMLKGIVYDDVVVALQSWKRLGIKVHVYSSGSIAAQNFSLDILIKDLF